MPYGGIWRDTDTPEISLDDLLTDSNVQMGYGPFSNIPERTLTDPTSMGGPGGGLGRPVSPFDSLLEFGRRNPNVLLSGIYRGGGTDLGVNKFTPPGDGVSLGMIWKEPGPSVFGEAINRPSGFQILDGQGLLIGPPKPRGYVDFDGAGRPALYRDPGLMMLLPFKPSAFDLLDPTKYRKPAGIPSWDNMPSDNNRWVDPMGRPRRTLWMLGADKDHPNPLPAEGFAITAMEGGKVKATADFIGTSSSIPTGGDWSRSWASGWDASLVSATESVGGGGGDEPYDNNGFDRTFGMSKCKDFFVFNGTGKNLNGNANLASAAGSSNPTAINAGGGGGGRSGPRLSGFESIDTNTESQPGGSPGGSPGGPPGGGEDCGPSESELLEQAIPVGGMIVPEGGCPPSDNVRIRMFQPTGDGLQPFGQLPRNLSASAAPLDPEHRGVPGGLPGNVVPEVSLAGVDAGEGFGAPLRSDVVGAVRDLLAGEPALAYLVEALAPQYPSPELQRQIDELNKPGVTGEIRHDAVSTQNNNVLMSIKHGKEDRSYFPRYDKSGNLIDDGRGKIFIYDASNQLVAVYGYMNYDPETDRTIDLFRNGDVWPIAYFQYDGLGRRISAAYDANLDGRIDRLDWRERYGYDHMWRMTAIWREAPAESATDQRPKPVLYQQYIYQNSGRGGLGGDAARGLIDGVAMRRRDTDGDGVLDETLYYIQNMRGDVTTVLRAPIKGVDPTYTGSGEGERPIVVERYRYSVWGIPTVYAAADINMDGLVDNTDYLAMRSAVLKFRQKPSQLVPRGDINQDGRVDKTDYEVYFMPAWQELMSTGGNGREQLSYSAGGVPEEWQWYPGNDAYQQTHLDNRLGFAGYVWDPWLKVYHVRHRVYDPFDTRWLQADPIGYAGGDTDLRSYPKTA